MKYFEKIAGERLFLSPINAEDYLLYCEWINDLEVASSLGLAHQVVGIAKEKETLERLIHQDVHLAIVRRADGSLLGNCSLFHLNHLHQSAETGIFIGPKDERNKGYGTEALKLLVDYAFSYLNLNNLMLRVFDYNLQGLAAYKKAGFTEFGRRTKSYFARGSFHDEVYMQRVRA